MDCDSDTEEQISSMAWYNISYYSWCMKIQTQFMVLMETLMQY